MISGPVSGGGWNVVGLTFLLAYLIGSFPNAYFIARHVTGEDITTHGSGNVGAMNVRRTTGSWTWFAVAMSADFIKGLAPVALAKLAVIGGLALLVSPWGATLASAGTGWWTVGAYYVPMAAVAGAVVGHNYSLWLGIIKKRLLRTGKGLATGAGALLAYDWRFFLAVVIVGLAVIAITHYMMAGQVVASIVLPIAAVVLHSPDWIFAAVMGALVYAAHHKRFIGMLQGKEPKFYIHDRQGPRG